MEQDQPDEWVSKADAARIIGCSEKTIERLAIQKKIQKIMRRIPGRRSAPAYHRGDIDAIAAKTAHIEPFPARAALAPPPGSALVPRDPERPGMAEMFFQVMTSGLPRAPLSPLNKIFLTLKEASEYSGMSRGWLIAKIKAGELPAFKAGGWKIRRADLEEL